MDEQQHSVRRRSEGAMIASSMWGAGILVSIAILVGSVAITFALLRSDLFGVTEGIREEATAPSVKNAPTPPTPTAKATGTTTLGKAPILGNPKTAKVAIVEWSDLECPFCKQFHEQTFDKIVADYVDTGKAVFAFRNYPLDFHGEAAIKEGNAALCVREVAGDKAYFSFVKDVYANTGTNGKGMPDSMLESLAAKAAGKSVATCLSSVKFQDVLDADLADGNEAGISGTPGFIIGTLGADGTVEGEIISGAMPYAEFKKAIDAALGASI